MGTRCITGVEGCSAAPQPPPAHKAHADQGHRRGPRRAWLGTAELLTRVPETLSSGSWLVLNNIEPP